MNIKQIVGVWSFLVVGFMFKAIGQPLCQAYLITDKDTLTMWETFITQTPVSLKITTETKEMLLSGCTRGSYFPTWEIANDSIFLIQLIDEIDLLKPSKILDLKQIFKERYIAGRVFGKEINYQIEAERFSSEYNPKRDSAYGNIICITIRNGKVIDRGEFNDTTVFSNAFEYLSEEGIAKNTDWKNLPDISANRLVTIKVIINEKGEFVKASIIKNKNTDELEGESVWKKEALRQVKLIPKWSLHHKCGQVVDKEREIEFLFKKPR